MKIDRYSKSASGLYVPVEDASCVATSATAPRPALPEERHRRRELKYLAIQSWATAMLLVFSLVSVPGFVLAYLAYRDQQSVNRAQQMITAEQQERDRRRYADIVNWWIELPQNHRPIIHIENRSSVPISPIAVGDNPQPSFELNDHDTVVSILGVPPCTAVSVTIPPNSVDFGSKVATLLFGDPVGTWIKHSVHAEPYTLDGYGIGAENFSDASADFYVKGKYLASLSIKTQALASCESS
jgi:hypothetical protein